MNFDCRFLRLKSFSHFQEWFREKRLPEGMMKTIRWDQRNLLVWQRLVRLLSRRSKPKVISALILKTVPCSSVLRRYYRLEQQRAEKRSCQGVASIVMNIFIPASHWRIDHLVTGSEVVLAAALRHWPGEGLPRENSQIAIWFGLILNNDSQSADIQCLDDILGIPLAAASRCGISSTKDTRDGSLRRRTLAR